MNREHPKSIVGAIQIIDSAQNELPAQFGAIHFNRNHVVGQTQLIDSIRMVAVRSSTGSLLDKQ